MNKKSKIIKHKPHAVVFCLEGGIADYRHRLHYVTNYVRDWTAFQNAAKDDVPVNFVINLMWEANVRNFYTILTTDRKESDFKLINKWLKKHEIRYDILVMRKDNDENPTGITKANQIKTIVDSYAVVDAFEETVQAASLWNVHGIKATLVDLREGNLTFVR